MGKVKDGSPAVSSAKATKTGSGSKARKGVTSFFANLVSTEVHKPLQGRNARYATAGGLGLVVALGLYQLFYNLISQTMITRVGVVALLGAALGWAVYRVVQFPPFVEFLIATEAEMNKVSWTSKEDLKRSTLVVLGTVLVMTVFLFGVDWLWSNILKLLHVIRITDTSSFGSNA